MYCPPRTTMLALDFSIHWIPIITVHYFCQWDSPKWHVPWWLAAMAAPARMHLQRWRSPCWHWVTAAIHSGSLEIRATKPLITHWAYNPLAAPSEWNAISLLQLNLIGERRERAARDTGQEVVVFLLSCSHCHLHSVIEGGREVSCAWIFNWAQILKGYHYELKLESL